MRNDEVLTLSQFASRLKVDNSTASKSAGALCKEDRDRKREKIKRELQEMTLL